jgi:hypothetical protein
MGKHGVQGRSRACAAERLSCSPAAEHLADLYERPGAQRGHALIVLAAAAVHQDLRMEGESNSFDAGAGYSHGKRLHTTEHCMTTWTKMNNLHWMPGPSFHLIIASSLRFT